MTEENQQNDDNDPTFKVNINEGEKEYSPNSCAAMVEFSVTVTRKYTQNGQVAFDVVGTERDRYVAQLAADDTASAINETLALIKRCREPWSIMGAVKDDEESQQEFVNNVETLSPLAFDPKEYTHQQESSKENEENKRGPTNDK